MRLNHLYMSIMTNRFFRMAFASFLCLADMGTTEAANDQSMSSAPRVEYYKVNGGTRPSDVSNLCLWYDFPSTTSGSNNPWMEYGLPIGNGQIGATLLGGVRQDEIILNEKTLQLPRIPV